MRVFARGGRLACRGGTGIRAVTLNQMKTNQWIECVNKTVFCYIQAQKETKRQIHSL
jgi:hypothetical protein